MSQMYVRLNPADRFLHSDSNGVTTGLALQALQAAGLGDAFLAGPLLADVGECALLIPSSFRNVQQDEADRLDSARQAAVRELERLVRFAETGTLDHADGEIEDAHNEAGARLVLLRGRAPARPEPYLDFEFLLRTGESIAVQHERSDLPPQMWAVIQVSAGSRFDGSGQFWFEYRLVHAIPDTGPLRVSEAHPSLSKSVCFDSMIRYLLPTLDLAEEPLPDRAAALSFLLDAAHRTGLRPGAVPAPYSDDGMTRRTFAERLLAAMGPERPDRAARVPPEPRLIKTFSDAERYAAEYMRYLGYLDAAPTPGGSDGGVDVTSRDAVAQVKMEGVPTGRPVVQAICGIAAHEDKSALVFSLAGYTAQAAEWADRAGVACFEYAVDGTVQAANRAASELDR